MKLEDILKEEKIELERPKVRKGQGELVRRTRVQDKDPRKKSRAKQKREWKKQIRDY